METKKHQKQLSSSAEAVDQLNNTLQLVYQLSEKLTAEEFKTCVQPIFRKIRYSLLAKKLRYSAKILVFLVCLFLLLACLSSSNYVREMAFIYTRLALVKGVVVWDWEHSGYRTCLMSNPLYDEPTTSLDIDSCEMCEAITVIDRVKNLSRLAALQDYLDVELPVIVDGAMNDWPITSRQNFSRFDFMQIFDDEIQAGEYFCRLKTNLRARNDMRVLFGKMANPQVKKWYAQWENCRKEAAKLLRTIYNRPHFLPSIVENTNYNFVLISSNYTGHVFKEVPVSADITWLAQIHGSTIVRFTPNYPCHHHCLDVTATLNAGEIIMFSDFLWSADYLPGFGTENLAIGVSGFRD